ncbi:hypothetical protein MSAN_01937700 [Mycena sanguinolenta]|uniref:Uncharacterized protein n=1 Tax=Mycena sanguinolenta TaxID=230812 RepID=A0A8H6XNJ0_9AGAR|nr:hypothetical protein MSAN_01937700 [Mycena sanguinolenta]
MHSIFPDGFRKRSFLLNVGNQVNANQSNVVRSEHLCNRCSNELHFCKPTLRHILILAALTWYILLFGLLIGHMVTDVITVFVTIWARVTLAVLIVLLFVGRRCYSHKLGRTVNQIRALCALGASWLLLMAGIIVLNVNTNADFMVFYAAHAFAWILTVTLFSAAYATYRRAIAVHGTTTTESATSYGSCLAAFWRCR